MGISKTVLQAQPWVLDKGDGITVQGSALTTDKSAATVHALTATTYKRISLQGPHSFTPALELRWRCSGAASQTNIMAVYAMADPHGKGDHYRLMGTLTTVTGSQVDGNGYYFVDDISIATEKWIDDIVLLTETGDNDMGSLAFNTQGYSDFVLVCTTLGSTAVFTDYRRI